MATSLLYQNNTTGSCFQPCFFDAWDEHNSNKPDATVSVPHHLLHQDESRREMKPSEDVLASELNKLSVQERNKALDDLHCVGEDLTETPELIENSLAEFDQILYDLNEPIYNVAASQNRAYVEDRDLRLKFLRSNNHDAEKAANQMIGFLKQKEIYFGREAIARDITLDDLDENDKEVLFGGRFHIQDALDRKGRHVVWFFNHRLHPSAESLCKANYFVYFNVLSPLTSVQTKGVVVCYYDMAKPGAPVRFSNMSVTRKYMAFMTTIPVRRTGMHFCLKTIPGSLFRSNFILETVFKGLQRAVKARVRVHYGSDIELQYKLRNHGLPMENVPVDTSGNLREDILNVWLYSYLAKERNQQLASASHPAFLFWAGEKKDEGINYHHGCEASTTASESTSSVIPWDSSIRSELGTVPSQSSVGAIPNVSLNYFLTEEWSQQLASSSASHSPLLLSGAGEEKREEVGNHHHHGVQSWNPWNSECRGGGGRTAAAAAAVPLDRKRSSESAASSVHRFVEPTDKDVLLGRGRGNQLHPGNVRFREFLKEYQDQYNHTPRYKRVKTSTDLTRLLLADGVRFLKMSSESSGDGCWEESDFSEAEKKVKQFFRSQKKLKATTTS